MLEATTKKKEDDDFLFWDNDMTTTTNNQTKQNKTKQSKAKQKTNQPTTDFGGGNHILVGMAVLYYTVILPIVMSERMVCGFST